MELLFSGSDTVWSKSAGRREPHQQSLLSEARDSDGAVGAGLVDFGVSCLVLGVLVAVYKIVPTIQIILILPFIVVLIAASLGVGMLLAALTVAYRDFRYVIPFLVQSGCLRVRLLTAWRSYRSVGDLLTVLIRWRDSGWLSCCNSGNNNSLGLSGGIVAQQSGLFDRWCSLLSKC